jgi:hypothetical protein
MTQSALKEIGLDYPRPEETVKAGTYTFRLTAPADTREVRVSVDDGPWMSCRRSDGRWWFDANLDAVGEHFAIGRVVLGDGSLIVISPRLFRVHPR